MTWWGKSKEEQELDEALERLEEKLQSLVKERDYYKATYERACDIKDKYHERVVAEKDSINKALAEENRDLVRQLELYKAVLAQLQIPIKLPARKQ